MLSRFSTSSFSRFFSSSPLSSPVLALSASLDANLLTSESLVKSSISAIESLNPSLNAFLSTDFSAALEASRAADKRRLAKSRLSPLDGIPLAVKDNFLYVSPHMHTTCGSRMLEKFKAPFNAGVVERLMAAGAIIIGKTNMDEFGMGSHNVNSYFGNTINPLSINGIPHSAGGSSGGSAAAVAGRLVPIAIGSDTGGSVRLPASYNGLVGLKPTYGRLSRHGLVAYASSLDTPGILAQDCPDAALLLSIMEGHDERDSTSLIKAQRREFRSFEFLSSKPESPPPSLKGVTVGIPLEYNVDILSPAMRDRWLDAAEYLRSLGANVLTISLPHTAYSLPAYYIIAPAEASSNLSRYDGVRYGHSQPKFEEEQALEKARRAEAAFNTTFVQPMSVGPAASSISDLYSLNRTTGFGAEVQRRILVGTFVLSSDSYSQYFDTAQRVRTLVSQDFQSSFNSGVDFILTPTACGGAPTLEEAKNPDCTGFVNDLFTVGANLAGLPALSVPAGGISSSQSPDSHWPVGLQLIGNFHQEPKLLKYGQIIQNHFNRKKAVKVE